MIKIVHQLRLARGSNKKLRILREHEDNRQWKRFLEATYDTGINYYVSAPADDTFLDEDPEEGYDEMFRILTRLSQRTWTGNAAKRVAKSLSEQFGELPRLILGGSIKAGVSTKTINKAYPGLIPEYPLMLAKDAKIREFPVYTSIKYDGVRILTTVRNHTATAITRNGKELELKSLLKQMAKQQDGVYDGELVYGNGFQAGRTKITGLVNKVLLGTSTEIMGYTYCIFDRVSLKEWGSQNCGTPFQDRQEDLLLHWVPGDNIQAIRHWSLNSEAYVQAAFEYAISHGFEGIMCRYKDDPYIWDRSDRLIKKKAICECKLKCVDTKEGTGKYKGCIGSLKCQGIVKGKLIEVWVGTGLTDEDRDNVPDYYLNHMVEIEYNDIVKAEGAEYYSLFLPRFKRRLRKD